MVGALRRKKYMEAFFVVRITHYLGKKMLGGEVEKRLLDRPFLNVSLSHSLTLSPHFSLPLLSPLSLSLSLCFFVRTILF